MMRPIARRLKNNVVVLRQFDEENTLYIYSAVEPSLLWNHSMIADYTADGVQWGYIGTRHGSSSDAVAGERTCAHAYIREAFPEANAQCMKNPKDVRLWSPLSGTDQHRIALARDKVRQADMQLAELLKEIGEAP